jgi:hypothetical protein
MYSDGSTFPVLVCGVLLRSDGPSRFDAGTDVQGCAVGYPCTSVPAETVLTQNATPSITLHSVSKLRLPPAFAHKTSLMQDAIRWK